MNDYELLPPVDVLAPAHALGWSPSRGFIDSVSELSEAKPEGEVILDVDDHGIVEAVEGEAPLAVAVRQDRELLEMRRAQGGLAERLQDIDDRQSGIDTDIAVRLTASPTASAGWRVTDLRRRVSVPARSPRQRWRGLPPLSL